MIGVIKGLATTIKTMLRSPVTVQYPDKHLPMAERFMGFPGLLWDVEIDESKCVGCKVCARYCPTDCMYVTMKDNENFAEGKSHRKKMVDDFVLDISRCIVCGICVEVCNFDAIVMSHEHEMSTYQRNGDRVDLPALLQIGRKYQDGTGWIPPTVLAKQKKAAEEAALAETNVEAKVTVGAGEASAEE